jgi:hypothetical protein
LDRHDDCRRFRRRSLDYDSLETLTGVSMLERFSTGASTFSGSIDHLIFLVAILVGFWLIVAEGALFWLAKKSI